MAASLSLGLAVAVGVFLAIGLVGAWALLLRRRNSQPAKAEEPVPADPAATPDPPAVPAASAPPAAPTRKVDPQALSAWRIGAGLARKGDYEAALATYRDALRLDPDLAEAWASLGLLHEQQGRHEDAIAAYREVVRLKP